METGFPREIGMKTKREKERKRKSRPKDFGSAVRLE